ncbi:hypothetical protein HDU93_008300 [Gonapodya sp. JEL0774]|nr:hypothetical protein HDU93_008300 [Gonapodya sp. JEL0774]
MQSFVVENFGMDAWEAIKKEAGCTVPNGGFAKLEYLPDSATVSLVVAGAKLLGVEPGVVLEKFGKYFVHFVIKNGYGGLLKAQGADLRSFIRNLNSLHAHLATSAFPSMLPPGFAVETPDGTVHTISEDTDEEFVVKYSSRRQGLAALAIGVLTEAALVLFESQIVCTVVRSETVMTEDDRGEGAGGLKEQYDSYLLVKTVSKVRKDDDEDDVGNAAGGRAKEDPPDIAVSKSVHSVNGNATYTSCPAIAGPAGPRDVPTPPTNSADPGSIPRQDAADLFPFHVVFDKTMRIVSRGRMIDSVAVKVGCAVKSLKGQNVGNVFEITSPAGATFEEGDLKAKMKDTEFTLRLRTTGSAPFSFTGQIYYLSTELFVFLCSPACVTVDQLVAAGLQLFDLPVHDKSKELVLINERLRAEVERNQRLENETRHLSAKKRSKISIDASAELLRYLSFQTAVEVFWLIVGLIDIVFLAISGLQAALSPDGVYAVSRGASIAFATFAALCVLFKIVLTFFRARSLKSKLNETRTGRFELILPSELGTAEGGQAAMSKAYGRIKQLDYDIQDLYTRLVAQIPNFPLLCIQAFIAFTGSASTDITPQLKISLMLGAVTIGAHMQLVTRMLNLLTERAGLLVKLQKEEVDKVDIRNANEKAVMEMLGKVVEGFSRAPVVQHSRRNTLDIPK